MLKKPKQCDPSACSFIPVIPSRTKESKAHGMLLYHFVDKAPISAIFKTRTLREYFTIENQPNALTKYSTCCKNSGKGLDDGSSHLMASNQDFPYAWYTVIIDQLKIPSCHVLCSFRLEQLGKSGVGNFKGRTAGTQNLRIQKVLQNFLV